LPLSEHVFGRWLFSHEEEGGARVYHPRGGDFAPSRRPRDGFDIEPDGRFRVHTPGAADASTARQGRWAEAGSGLEVTYDDDGPGLALEIVDAAPGVLRVRRA
jgi:hypothetical protein